MTKATARLIREIKKHCTYRRLAEIYYPEHHRYYGMQFAGEDLCKHALEKLYPAENIWGFGDIEQDSKFKKENKSYLGDFYWWE